MTEQSWAACNEGRITAVYIHHTAYYDTLTITLHFQVVAHALQQCIVLTQYYVLLFHPIQPGATEAKNLFMQWQAGEFIQFLRVEFKFIIVMIWFYTKIGF